MNNNNDTEIATVANGCFWCSEAIFKRLRGVKFSMRTTNYYKGMLICI
jgi:peptide methionine sulfoxide reductase MsrA